ncbi:MAG: hypothetical protein RLZZ450_519 [Pseudomonadota bacterium]
MSELARKPADFDTARVRLIVNALVTFGVLVSTAAAVYPGGTWQQRASLGFSFWNNFWCDLLSTRALNGQTNLLGASLARVAFACFALALFQFWPLVAAHANPERPHATARGAGRFGAVSLLAVAVVPAATSQLVHGVAVVVSAGASLAAVSMLLPGLLRQGEHKAVWLATSTLVVFVVCLLDYVSRGALGGAAWLAGAQKIATALLLAFMVHVLMRERARVVHAQ